MFDQPPFPALREVSLHPESDREATVAVIVPTRNRPDRLARCLASLAVARDEAAFRVYVCDSSREDLKHEIAEICARYPFVELIDHSRIGASAARNVGTEACTEDLVVSVDDDVYVEPAAITELVRVYDAGQGTRVVAGSVNWGNWISRPLVMRWIGFARDAEPGEQPELVVSALVLYPRALGLLCPWNERLWPIDDLFASRLWRLAGADLMFAPHARARHDETHSSYPVANEADQIYTNLFDAILVTGSPGRLVLFEVLGFAACAKKWARTPRGAYELVRAWGRGHLAFVQDFRRLRSAVRVARAGRVGKEATISAFGGPSRHR